MLWVGRGTGTTSDRSAMRHTGAMRVVGLLRGRQPRHSRQLKMAELRAAVESLGHTDVETYLQSGNVVFTPAAKGASQGPRGGHPRLRSTRPSAWTSAC